MNQDDVFDRLKDIGLVSTMLPPWLNSIRDDVYYSTANIAEILAVNPETVRRWFRSGKLKSLSIHHYKTDGMHLKHFVIRQLYPKLARRHLD